MVVKGISPICVLCGCSIQNSNNRQDMALCAGPSSGLLGVRRHGASVLSNRVQNNRWNGFSARRDCGSSIYSSCAPLHWMVCEESCSVGLMLTINGWNVAKKRLMENVRSARDECHCKGSSQRRLSSSKGRVCWSNHLGQHNGGKSLVCRYTARRDQESLTELHAQVLSLIRSGKRKRVVLKANGSDHCAPVKEVESIFQRGILIEIEKDSGKSVCVVAQRPDGKRNWIAEDQHGNTYSVRPTQVRYVVPDVKDFKPADITNFLENVEDLEDATLLEVVWEELLLTKGTVDTVALSEILFGSTGPKECYASHRLLSCNQMYFRCKQKGTSPLYEPRSVEEVQELQNQAAKAEVARQELNAFVDAARSAVKQPVGSKPSPEDWNCQEHYSKWIAALKAFALDSCESQAQKKLAWEVLESLCIAKVPTNTVDLLIKMGVFPVHVNIELLKSKVRIEFPENVLASTRLMESEPDKDVERRVDLRHLKVYTIDCEDPDEIDDGLSAVKLPDGQLELWVHIADPTRWVHHEHLLQKEAKIRGTSIYLPEQTIPMFPLHLGAGHMSLRQGIECSAVSICIKLNTDGSIEEKKIMCSTIRPSYQLTYDQATELIMLNIEEEEELRLLADAAALRRQWRKSQGAVDHFVPIANARITNAETPEPDIKIYVTDMSSPAEQLVSEMMVMCGEAIAEFGRENGLALPYRGQPQIEMNEEALQGLPQSPSRDIALIRAKGPVGMNFNAPLPHAGLGLPGYVQFTSPIRRYTDLIAHYQVKAILRDEKPPFTGGQLEASIMMANMRTKESRRLATISTRYWVLEHLRRQPKDAVFSASLIRNVREGEVLVLLKEIGIQATASSLSKLEVGSEISVSVVESHPRRNILILNVV